MALNGISRQYDLFAQGTEGSDVVAQVTDGSEITNSNAPELLGDDYAEMASGKDHVLAGKGSDAVHGEDGGAGSDVLYRGAGNDLISADAADGKMDCLGDGHDVYKIHEVYDVIIDEADYGRATSKDLIERNGRHPRSRP